MLRDLREFGVPVAEVAYAATRRMIAAHRDPVDLDSEPVLFHCQLIERDSVVKL